MNRVDRSSKFRNAIERETGRGWKEDEEPLVLIQQIRSIKPQIATDWRKLQRTKTTNTVRGGFTMLPEAADTDGIRKSTDVTRAAYATPCSVQTRVLRPSRSIHGETQRRKVDANFQTIG